MNKREIKAANWAVTAFGTLLILLGYYLVSPITRDYETPRAFFAILTLNLGLLTVILGLAVNYDFLNKCCPFSKKSSDVKKS